MLLLSVLSFLSLIPRLLLGFWAVHIFWGVVEIKYLLVKIFLSGIIGLGISSLFSFLWIWAGFPMHIYVIVESTIVVIITFLLANKKKLGAVQYFEVKTTGNIVWFLLLVIGFSVFLINLVILGFDFPHGRIDAWMNWNVVSRFIFRGGEHWQNTFLRPYFHPDYPFFVPIINAVTWTYIQKETFLSPIILHFTISVLTVGLLFSLVNVFKDFKQAVLASLLFISQPFVVGSGMNQYADIPLSYAFLAIGGLILLYFETKEKKLIIIAGFVTGLAAWVKNEGIVLLITSTALWLFIQFIHRDKVFKNYLYGLIFPASVVILFKLFLAPESDLFVNDRNIVEYLLDVTRYTYILKSASIILWTVDGGYISVIGCLIFYSLFIGKSQKEIHDIWALGSIIILQLLAYFVIYLITPHNLDWHLKTALSRLYLHVYPLFFLALFVWLKSPDELLAKETEAHAPRH